MLRVVTVVLGTLTAFNLSALAQNRQTEPDAPPRANIWDVRIGMTSGQIPEHDFIDISCGTNGGPPSILIDSFTNFSKCPPEGTGLHEVYFAYDDELEYWARANEYITWIAIYSGTKVMDQPVILSALFDGDGIVKGIRIISDARADPQQRLAAIVMRRRFTGRYGEEGWACEDLPPREGEKPFRRQFIKELCTKIYKDQLRVRLESHYYQKSGQTTFDPHTGQPQQGYFESTVRLELYHLSVPVDQM